MKHKIRIRNKYFVNIFTVNYTYNMMETDN